jgi:hypothetical protein
VISRGDAEPQRRVHRKAIEEPVSIHGELGDPAQIQRQQSGGSPIGRCQTCGTPPCRTPQCKRSKFARRAQTFAADTTDHADRRGFAATTRSTLLQRREGIEPCANSSHGDRRTATGTNSPPAGRRLPFVACVSSCFRSICTSQEATQETQLCPRAADCGAVFPGEPCSVRGG